VKCLDLEALHANGEKAVPRNCMSVRNCLHLLAPFGLWHELLKITSDRRDGTN